jgi:hypothetical protein
VVDTGSYEDLLAVLRPSVAGVLATDGYAGQARVSA